MREKWLLGPLILLICISAVPVSAKPKAVNDIAWRLELEEMGDWEWIYRKDTAEKQIWRYIQEGDIYYIDTETPIGTVSLRIFWIAKKLDELDWEGHAVVWFNIEINGKTYKGTMVGRSHITGETQEITGRFIGKGDECRIKGIISWNDVHNYLDMYGKEYSK